jgi:glutamyl-tRNA synthetase
MVLRFEDTDIEREVEGAERAIMDDFSWLGIGWEEGPDKGGRFGPYRQSERLDLYKSHADRLLRQNLAYPCFCSVTQLEEDRKEAEKKRQPPRYVGRCRNLNTEEIREKMGQNPTPTLRFRVDFQKIQFNDLIRGPVAFHTRNFGDFILVRSDGRATYHLAVVVDDGLMEITHVIRGEEHLSNTPLHILLFQALGFPVPEFGHLPMILGPDKNKLSKRHGKTSLRQFEEEGILPEAMVHYLAQLGTGADMGQGVVGKDELVGSFSLEKISKAPAVFDEKKLRWLNALYLRGIPGDDLVDRVRNFLRTRGFVPEELDHAVFPKWVEAIRDNLTVLSDALWLVPIFFDHRFEVDPGAEPVLLENGAPELLDELRHSIEETGEITPETYREIAHKVGSRLNVKGKKLYQPIRVAVTGRTTGPELEKVFPVLGRDSLLKRIDQVLKRFG